MAKVVITLEDSIDPKGVQTDFDWGFHGEEPTQAQIMGMVALETWRRLSGQNLDDSEN